MAKFWQTPDKIPSLWHTSGKVIHKIKVCGNVLASFLKFDTFWQCYGNLPLVAKLFAITLPLAAKIGTVLWHRIPLPQSCCNLVATLRQRIFFIRACLVLEVSGSIPARGEKKIRCLNTLSLVSFAGMTLDKCIVLWIGTLTGCPLCRESHTLCRLKNPTVI